MNYSVNLAPGRVHREVKVHLRFFSEKINPEEVFGWTLQPHKGELLGIFLESTWHVLELCFLICNDF